MDKITAIFDGGQNDTDKIIVEDGHIYIKIMPNTASTTRNGIVYLTTIMPGSLYTGESTVKRIKIDITQRVINKRKINEES